MKLKGKKVVVTGASSGLGQAMAIAFAQEGADIVFSYQGNFHGAKETEQKIKACGCAALAIQANLQDLAGLNHLMNGATQFLNGIDVLVNNAGTLTRHANFLEISTEQFDLVQSVNVRAPFILIQWAAKQMIKQGGGGSIINVSSASGEVVSPGLAHYECSKAAINMLTKSMASELAKHNIRVNAIAPGLFATNLNANQHQGDTDVWEKRCSRIPLKRAGRPEDIAALALLLASDEGSLITGDIIAIDGGIGINSLVR